jgi:hypothetical protein
VKGRGGEDRVHRLVELELDEVGREGDDRVAEAPAGLGDHRFALPSTAITLPFGTRSASTAVTRPVPQPGSSTRSSPRRSSRSMTSRAIAAGVRHPVV